MKHENVYELFDQVAAKFSGNIALARGTETITYGELLQRSNKLANYLISSGASKGSLVAFLLEDPIQAVTTIIATLKAGCVFVPLEPNIPPNRLARMIAEVSPEWFVVESQLVEQLNNIARGSDYKVIRVDGDEIAAAQDDSVPRPTAAPGPDDMCYIYFTSGSTGRPKAIAGRLKGIDHFIRWEINELKVDSEWRVSQLLPLSFDGSLRDIFVPLCSGARLCVPETRETLLEPQALLGWLEREEINLVHCIPSLFRSLLNEELRGERLPSLRYIVMTGEALLPRDVKRWMDVFGERVQLLNLYGTSETTLAKFVHYVTATDAERRSIPVGKPIPGARALIVSEEGAACPPGVIGEIYIRTPYRSLGYYKQPELTSEVFIQNPFSEEAGDIVYKTGDMGRVMEDGEIELLGRKDEQVKIRGVRIELPEIEKSLREAAEIKDVAVIDREDREGTKYLCAYVVGDGDVDFGKLRAELSQQLPENMMPSAFVLMEKLPRTISGKIDRRSLPAPGEALKKDYVKPRTAVEELLAGIWCEVLGVTRVGIKDSFFDLGGHSLLATQVMSRVRAALGVELPLRTLFETPAVEDLAPYLESVLNDKPASPSPPIKRVAREGSLPLSFAQQRLWFISQFEPDSSVYAIASALRLTGDLNVAALEQCLNEIVRRHESFRTIFSVTDGEPAQIVQPQLNLRLNIADLQQLPAHARERHAEQLAIQEAQRPFNLAEGPLLRATLLQLDAQDWVILFTMHHIISDGWSAGVLIREVAALYEVFSTGKPSPFAELKLQYVDFAVWQRQWLQGSVLEEQLSYWRDQLRGAPPLLELPGDRPRPRQRNFEGDSHSFVLPKNVSEAIKILSRRQGVTTFMLLLAAFKTLLHRYTGQEDIVVGSAIANRTRTEIEPLIGFFVNALAIRTDLSGNPTFRELLGRVRGVTLAAYNHQDVPFEKLVEVLEPERNLSYSPIYQVEFTLQNAPVETLNVQGLTLSPVAVPQTRVETDFNFIMAETDQGLVGTVAYPTDLFDAATISRMMRHFQTLLGSVVTNPDQRLSELPLMTEDELQPLFAGMDGSKFNFPTDQCIHQLFESQVNKSPDALALVLKDQQVTYRELNQRANQLAHYLRKRDVGAEVRVGLYLESSLDMVAGLLGILKAGGAFVPLDPSYPKERLAFMLEDANVSLLLSHQRLENKLPTNEGSVIWLDTEWETIARESDQNPAPSSGNENLAYVMYTSGSTGRPNGVLIEHGALVNYTRAMQDEIKLQSSDRILQFASLSFDVAVEEIFPALSCGAAIILREETLAPTHAELLRMIEEQQLTTVELPTAYWHEWVDDLSRNGRRLPSSLRFIIMGGEKVSPERLSAWKKLGIPLVHVYGLTETTVTSTVYKFNAQSNGFHDGAGLPIGRSITNSQVYLLDSYLQPVPTGVEGELYVGGFSVARGYLNRPRLTAERFVPDPFSNRPGALMYRTGDRARRLPDGNLLFVDRIDHQMKVRGYRIEPGEIETVLRQHSIVEDAVVMTSTNGHQPLSLIKNNPDGSIALEDREVLVGRLSALSAEETNRLFAGVEELSEEEVETLLALDLQRRHEREQTKIRRYPQFDISIKLKDDQFINPPLEGQRSWLIRRTLDEIADDLRHLDKVSRRFVPGSARPRLAPELAWHKSQARYDESELIIEGQQVMQDWEAPLMEAMAKVVTESHGDVLELGFGMGISATYIQKFGVRSYTIVEYNDEVVKRFQKWKQQFPNSDIRLIHGRWHNVIDQLGMYDGVFFDTVPTYEEEYLREVIDNIVMAEDFFPVAAKVLRKGGIFTWYTNEIDTLSRRHQRLIQEYFSSYTVTVARPLYPPEDCHYWFADSMVVVKAVK